MGTVSSGKIGCDPSITLETWLHLINVLKAAPHSSPTPPPTTVMTSNQEEC